MSKHHFYSNFGYRNPGYHTSRPNTYWLALHDAIDMYLVNPESNLTRDRLQKVVNEYIAKGDYTKRQIWNLVNKRISEELPEESALSHECRIQSCIIRHMPENTIGRYKG